MTRTPKSEILEAIRTQAAKNGGSAPGQRSFSLETGIPESDWRGVHWARWSDAVCEAGLEPNERKAKVDKDEALEQIARAFQGFGRIPTSSEWRMKRRSNSDFPSYDLSIRRFGSTKGLVDELRAWVQDRTEFSGLKRMLGTPSSETNRDIRVHASEGYVYLIASGKHFKVGRSDELERRVKSITVALPESAKLVHSIRTDDPPGIEAYWHRRFANRRANGEWFALTKADVAAFKRRRFQ